MGFHIETAEMKKALERYQKLSRTAQEQLDNAKNSMNGIINSNAMYGQVGQAIAADINNNKNAVLVGLKNSYKLVEADLQNTYADFAGTTGETSQSAVLDEDVLTKAKTAIDKFKTEHKEKRQTIKSTYNDIADLISLSMPSSSTFTSACDEAKKQVDKIIQKVNEFDSKQQSSSAEEIINVLSQQIKMSETASGVSYTDPRFMEFVSQTGLAESIQDIDSQIAQAEADAKLEAEKAAKEKQEQWAKDHPLENTLRNFSDGIGSWWNGIVKGTKGLNTEGFFLLETGKGILLVLESTVGFVGDGISSLAIGSVQVGQLLGGGLATGINNLRGVKSPDWIGKDWLGTVKNVQALTPSAIFEMSKAAIGSMADDFKRGDIYDMTTDVLTVGTMLTAANGLKNTAKNVTTKLKAPKVGSVVDDVAKGASRFKPKKVTLNNGEIVYKSKDGILVRSADYLDEAGNIKWPKHDGFYLDEVGNPIMKNANIKKGQILDRYGDSGGTFTSPVENGKVLNYDSRGLPYPESVMDYHKYEVVKDINIKNVQQGFDNLSLVDQKELHRLMNKYHFNLGDMANPQSGIVSEVFGSGGGTQIKLGTSVSWYEKLGILKEIK